MAQNKTKYGRKVMLDHFLGRIDYPFSNLRYVALFSSDPTSAGLLTGELTQGGYSRQSVASLFSDAVLETGQISNAAEIVFSQATEDWNQITHLGIMEIATIGAGNMVYFGPATSSRVIPNGEIFIIRIGQLVLLER